MSLTGPGHGNFGMCFSTITKWCDYNFVVKAGLFYFEAFKCSKDSEIFFTKAKSFSDDFVICKCWYINFEPIYQIYQGFLFVPSYSNFRKNARLPQNFNISLIDHCILLLENGQHNFFLSCLYNDPIKK